MTVSHHGNNSDEWEQLVMTGSQHKCCFNGD